jgi:hypothetical protein
VKCSLLALRYGGVSVTNGPWACRNGPIRDALPVPDRGLEDEETSRRLDDFLDRELIPREIQLG